MPEPKHICWDENGGLYLPPQYAYIGVAMDRRDAADEMQRAFDLAGRARRGLPMHPWDEIAPTSDADPNGASA